MLGSVSDGAPPPNIALQSLRIDASHLAGGAKVANSGHFEWRGVLAVRRGAGRPGIVRCSLFVPLDWDSVRGLVTIARTTHAREVQGLAFTIGCRAARRSTGGGTDQRVD